MHDFLTQQILNMPRLGKFAKITNNLFTEYRKNIAETGTIKV